jgi:hypothetical protein
MGHSGRRPVPFGRGRLVRNRNPEVQGIITL